VQELPNHSKALAYCTFLSMIILGRATACCVRTRVKRMRMIPSVLLSIRGFVMEIDVSVIYLSVISR